MKIYRVHSIGDFGGAGSWAIWFSRKRDFSKYKRELMGMEDGGTEPKLETFEVQTNKAALIAFLNRHCSQ